jgi:DNA-binding transcriptional LysR family regulator
MDGLQRLQVFVNVVQHGNMSSAGRHLGLSPATVSRQVSALENELGCLLLSRSSRKVTLTEAGRIYYSRIERILQQLIDTNEEIAALQTNPRGMLRVHSRTLVGHLHVVPLVPAFLKRYPEITVDLQLSNRVVGLVEENIDVDIRIGKLIDSSLSARKLAPAERVLCASAEYLRGRPPIERPKDLLEHNCLSYRINLGRTVWRFRRPGEALEEIPIQGTFQTDNGLALLTATLGGTGVALMPDWSVSADLAAGRLLRVLPEYEITHMEFDNGIYAVFQRSPLMSAKTRVFIDFLASALAERLRR